MSNLFEHILYLEGLPNMQRLGSVQVGETVPEQFKLDLEAELGMLNLYAEGTTHCAKVDGEMGGRAEARHHPVARRILF